MHSTQTQSTQTEASQVLSMEDILKIRARQQAAIAELGQKALAGVELWELFELTVSTVAQTMEAELSAVIELLPHGEILALRAGVGWHEGVVGHDTISAQAQSHAGYTLMTNQPVIFEDLLSETRFEPALLLLNHGVTSGVSVIIPGETQHFGVLAVYTTQKHHFTQDDIVFLQGIAFTLAMAIRRKQADEALQNSNTILQAIIEGTPDAIFVKDRQGKIMIINSAGAQVFGKSVEEVTGKPDSELWPPEAWPEIKKEDHRVMVTGQTQTFENVVHTSEGTHIFHTIKTPYRNSQGQIIGVIGVARDITDLKQAELSQRMLAEAGQLLSSSMDYTARLASVAKLAVPYMADWCAVDILDEHGQVQRLAVAHIDPAKVELAHELQRRYPPDPNTQTGVFHVLRTGQSEIYPKITEEMLVAAAQDEAHLQIVRDLQIRSGMVVPLIARGRTLGAISFVWAESNRHYDIVDLSMAEELARRAALAVDNARLFKTEQEARRAAEWTAKRMSSLQAVTAVLAQALNPVEVAEAITRQGLSILGAESGSVVLLDATGEFLEIIYAFNYSAKIIEKWQRFPLSTPVPLADVVRTGRPVYINSPEEMTRRYPHFIPHPESQSQAWALLPLTIEGQTSGGIGLSFTEPQNFSRKDRAFMTVLARQCAQAMERARLYEAEQAAQKDLALLAETRERNRLAEDLHDNVAQALGYLNLKMTVTAELLAKGQVEEVAANLGELKQVIGETYTDVREEIFNLRAKVSSGVSFLELLNRYIDKYKRFYDLDIQLIQEAELSLFEFPQEVSPQIMRTIQEALINVRKHARVRQATIRLSGTGDHVCITVEDKGQGFDLAAIKGANINSFGLQIMQDRVRRVGGALEINTTPGQGTQIILRYAKP